jgi:hypothetical protein
MKALVGMVKQQVLKTKCKTGAIKTKLVRADVKLQPTYQHLNHFASFFIVNVSCSRTKLSVILSCFSLNSGSRYERRISTEV